MAENEGIPLGPAAEQGVNRKELTRLATLAALAPAPDALTSWNELTTTIPFDELPHLVIRAMPAIYLSLKDQTGANSFALLKGVYRSSWSSNALRFAQSRNLFDAFNESGVDYRVIKGGAICALSGNWAIRRMGDIDVVIAPGHESQCVEVMKEQGFRIKVSDGSVIDAAWENAQGAVIDLHTTDGKSAIFRQLFRDPGSLIEITNTPIRIPSAELTAALSIWHAKKGTAGTDQIQTLLDLGSLDSLLNFDDLRPLLLRSELISIARKYFKELESLGLIPTGRTNSISKITLREQPAALVARSENAARSLSKAATFPEVVRRRKLTCEQRARLKEVPGVNGVSYRLWANLGQLRPIEVIMCDKFGGFSQGWTQGGLIPDRDYRIRIPATPNKPTRLELEVVFDTSDNPRPTRALYINGEIKGFVPLPDNAAGIYELTPKTNFLEISIRTFDSHMHAPIKYAHASCG